jgi:hypothetical protein
MGDPPGTPSGESDSVYPGDEAPKGQIARWMADGAGKAGLPPELRVMAALAETGLRNLTAGDDDSLGYFQISAKIWNRGAYLGFPESAELQLQWFLDTRRSSAATARIHQLRCRQVTDPASARDRDAPRSRDRRGVPARHLPSGRCR